MQKRGFARTREKTMAKLPKKYIQKYGISKRAWREYRKNKKRKGNPKTKGGNKTARKKGKRRFPIISGGVSIYKAVIEPVFGNPSKGFAGAKAIAENQGIEAGLREYIDIVGINFTGFKPSTGQFLGITHIAETYGSMILGYVAGKIATKVGANRALAKIPIVGDYLKIG